MLDAPPPSHFEYNIGQYESRISSKRASELIKEYKAAIELSIKKLYLAKESSLKMMDQTFNETINKLISEKIDSFETGILKDVTVEEIIFSIKILHLESCANYEIMIQNLMLAADAENVAIAARKEFEGFKRGMTCEARLSKKRAAELCRIWEQSIAEALDEMLLAKQESLNLVDQRYSHIFRHLFRFSIEDLETGNPDGRVGKRAIFIINENIQAKKCEAHKRMIQHLEKSSKAEIRAVNARDELEMNNNSIRNKPRK